MMDTAAGGEAIRYLCPFGVVLDALIIIWSEFCMSYQVRLMIIEAVHYLQTSTRNG